MKFTCTNLEYLTMQHFGVRQNIIVPNVHWGISRWKEGIGPLHECDVLILSKSGYATEVEIKISKADLLKDSEKLHGHDHPMIKYLYFCVPENLKEIALEVIPARAGLLVAESNEGPIHRAFLKQIKSPTQISKPVQWNEKEKMKLLHLGCMRILGLKKKLSKNLTLKK
ncbi:hypothetical protein [Aequorivita echinoideorum]|uniref:MmcB family DNA repair protein n=1 Tax=Aequorivita echinoideorum TaxID=1549647 RepID=A0ABS5S344_9FLAO|nr:hypothetical protein [Aequorivita echinoideorum]MBT0607616.1 hypothetical protein [Aequorivita echinoideorum]